MAGEWLWWLMRWWWCSLQVRRCLVVLDNPSGARSHSLSQTLSKHNVHVISEPERRKHLAHQLPAVTKARPLKIIEYLSIARSSRVATRRGYNSSDDCSYVGGLFSNSLTGGEVSLTILSDSFHKYNKFNWNNWLNIQQAWPIGSDMIGSLNVASCSQLPLKFRVSSFQGSGGGVLFMEMANKTSVTYTRLIGG